MLAIHPYRLPGGGLVHYEETFHPIKDDEDQIIGVSIFARDVTRRVNAEKARNESEAIYRSLVELSPDGIIIAEDGITIRLVNNAMLRLLGFEKQEDVLGKSLYSFIHAHYQGLIHERLDNRAATQGDNFIYQKLIRADGILIASRGIILYVNQAVLKILGATRDQLQGKQLLHFIHPDFHEQERLRIEQLELHGQAVEFMYQRYKRTDGQLIHVEVAATPIDLGGGNTPASQIFIRDITERKQAEESIRASLHEKEILLAEIHHRVKNNMAVISGLLELQAGYVQDEQARALFRESQNRIKSMALIHEKLYESKTFANIDMHEYIEELTHFIKQSYVPAGVQIEVEMQVDNIQLDITRAVPCGLILNELVSNAYKHAFAQQTTGAIRVVLQKENAGYCLSVSDNGKGLPDNLDVYSPTSLGLTLVNALSMQLNANLHVSNDVPQGTVFSLFFKE
jgi:PAS domain S-box-containing protein